MMMLATGHTATTGMLAVLADTAVAGGYVAATVEREVEVSTLRIWWGGKCMLCDRVDVS